ncbi:hypothetical protein ZOSMA_11G00010 [Zostera marina]|uniref:CCHC-type domain-containing protein n=1 Tax=Zostera marina TaxID=29655 RepID=A0A0K9Q102_ZOSMR|nr:hypothetical protein ZOSMA_11G00010 [Zostera marina]
MISWEEFLQEFEIEFHPRHLIEEAQDKFRDLVQGTKTVTEYANQFVRLEKYFPTLYADEAGRVRIFVVGLQYGLQSKVMSSDPDTLSKAVDCAYRQDEVFRRGLKQRRMIEEGPNKRPRLTNNTTPLATRNKDICSHCQKSHPGKEPCLKCGVVGHFIKDCPRRIADH